MVTMGFCVWLAFKRYARPSELISRVPRSAVQPLALQLVELGRAGKTQIRHGTSHDRLVEAKSPRSVRRYVKLGRVVLQLQRRGPEQSQALIAEPAMNFAMCSVKHFSEHNLVNPGSLSSSSAERARWHDAWR